MKRSWSALSSSSKFLFFYGLILLLAVPLAFHQIYANDIWKALYSGRYLALFQGFPHHSTFTFSPVKEIVIRDTYNWLGNLTLLGVYTGGGVSFLQWFRFSLVLFAVLLPLSLVNYRKTPVLLLFTFCYMVGIKQKLIMRTAMFAVPGMVVLFWLLLKADEKRSAKLLWGLPVLFLFWSNMHGSYLAGLVFLILAWLGVLLDEYWLGRARSTIGSRKLGTVLLVVLCLVIIVKPFPDYKFPKTASSIGTRIGGALLSPLSSGLTGDSQASAEDGSADNSLLGNIKEGLRSWLFASQSWRSSEYSFPLLSYSFLFVSMTLLLFPLGFSVFALSGPDFRFFHFLPLLGAFALSITYLRTVGYFPLVVFPITLRKVQAGHLATVKMGRVVRYASLIAVAVLSFNLGYYMVRGQTARFFGVQELKIREKFTRRVSSKVPAYVLREFPRERMFTQYNVSAYLIWKWWPYKKVFFDSKGSAYTDSFFRAYGTTLQGKLMDTYDLDYAINPYPIPLLYNYFIPDSDWRLVAFDEGMVMIGRSNRTPLAEPLSLFLLTADEFKRLRPGLQNSLREFINFLHARRNLAKLSISKQHNVVLEDETVINSTGEDRSGGGMGSP